MISILRPGKEFLLVDAGLVGPAPLATPLLGARLFAAGWRLDDAFCIPMRAGVLVLCERPWSGGRA